jgi:S-DNA-T family DNA segregation ATPase FtsK/SpoIIIE
MTDQLTPPPPAAPPGAAPRRPRPETGKDRRWFQDWNWRSHPPALTTINIALGLFTATWIGHDLGIPSTVALIGGAIGALGALTAAVLDDRPGALIAWRIACWALPSVWATAALAWSPWHPVVFVAALGAGTGFGVIAQAIHTARRTAEEAALAKAARGTGLSGTALTTAPADEVWRSDKPEATNVEALAANWTARIKRVAHTKVIVTAVGMWAQGAGYTLRLKLPLGGTSWRDLANFAEALAEDAQLPADCGITVKGGGRRGTAEMKVTHRNMLKEMHPAPADYSPTSIYQAAVLGILPDGALFKVVFKWIWFVITGQTDSGKTSLLHLINLYLFRCVDAIVWHIDVGGGGGISRPWVTPWHEGRAPHPNVDWVATTIEEVELMLSAAIKITEGRKRIYPDRLEGGKLVCSAEVPHIEIISDETATLPERLKDMIIAVNQTSRAAGIRGGTSALRPTADDLPTAIKKHSRLRIGMRVSDRDEIGYLFDNAGKVDPELAKWQGSGWVEQQDEDETGEPVGPKYVTPAKMRYLDDAQIDEAAVAVAHLRPDLDAPSVTLADSAVPGIRAYTDRWTRTLPHLFVIGDEPEADPRHSDPDRAARIAAAEARQEELHRTGGTITERLNRIDELKEQILSEPGPSPAQGVDPETVAELTEGLPDDNLVAVFTIVDRAGATGIGPADILRSINAARATDKQITVKTVQRKLDELVSTKVVVKTGRGVYVAAARTDQEGPTDER